MRLASACVLVALVGAARADAPIDRARFVAAQVAASSAHAKLSPAQAVTGAGTSWCTAGTASPIGAWLEVTFDRPIAIADIGLDTALDPSVVAADADTHFARATVVALATSDGRTVTARLTPEGAFHAPLGGAPITSLRATIRETRGPADHRVSCISALVLNRGARGDNFTLYPGAAADLAPFADDLAAIHAAVATCDTAALGKVMAPAFDRWATHPDRHVPVRDAAALAALCRDHHYQLARSAAELVEHAAFDGATRASTFDASFTLVDHHWRFAQVIDFSDRP